MMEKELSTYRVKKISPTVYYISDVLNDLMYLVTGKDRALLIDTGYGYFNVAKLCAELTSLPLTVVLTHAHPDHTMGAGLFPEVLLNERDFDLFHESYRIESRRMKAKEFEERVGKLDPEAVEQWVSLGECALRPVADGDEFDLGGRVLKVIATPGHTRGGITLLDEAEERLFSGDSVVDCNHLLNLRESDTLEAFHAGLMKLLAVSDRFQTIHPGHEKAPLPKSKLTDLIGGVEDILAARIQPVKIDDNAFGTPAAIYAFAGNNTLLAPKRYARR